jgi:hypothetical protein
MNDDAPRSSGSHARSACMYIFYRKAKGETFYSWRRFNFRGLLIRHRAELRLYRRLVYCRTDTPRYHHSVTDSINVSLFFLISFFVYLSLSIRSNFSTCVSQYIYFISTHTSKNLPTLSISVYTHIYIHPKNINIQQTHFSIYDAFYSQNPQQHVSAGIPAILMVILLYKNTKIQMWLTVSQLLYNNYIYNFG